MFQWNWYSASVKDWRVIDLYSRHYSSRKGGKNKSQWRNSGIAKPGEKIVLLTAPADALFVWTLQKYRQDNNFGVECSVFRNESQILSSTLILEAEQLALAKWQNFGQFFTFVDPVMIKSTNAGYCFIRAGWERRELSPKGLLLLTKQLTKTTF